jgi:acyl dehydratase
MYFEDYKKGQITRFGAYAVTESEIKEFATKYDPQYFHLDNEAARDSVFGSLCASGWHTCAMLMRMLVDNLPPEHGTLGSPGVNEVKWLTSVYPGDVLSVKSKVNHKRLSKSRPSVGIVSMNYSVVNQKNETVMRLEANAFIKTTNSTTPNSPAIS